MTDIVEHLKEIVSASCRILARFGLADYVGSPSARIPGEHRFVIKPHYAALVRGSMRGFAEMGPEDMVVCDMEGNVLEGLYRAPGEIQSHIQVYLARPDVGGVIHTHQRATTAWGLTGKPLRPLLHLESGLLSQGVGVYPAAGYTNSPERGAALARALGPSYLCYMQCHGVIVVGPSLEAATMNAIDFEKLAEFNLMAEQLSDVSVMSAESLREIAGDRAYNAARWDYYCHLVAL